MRIFQSEDPREIKRLLQEISVDPYGVEVMVPKGVYFLIRLNALSNMCANILKQEMLSLGADAAVARGALTGKVKSSDCLLMGSYAQLTRLCDKLKPQPFGLGALGKELANSLKNYQKDQFTLSLGKYKLKLWQRSHIMGIINLTPDSFSGDGFYGSTQPIDILGVAARLEKSGADILDVGGESSRPGARPVSVKEELRRVIPAIKKITRKINIPVSIDTVKPEVARQALDNGATMVNDITGLSDPRMAKVAARYKAAVVIMHMKGKPGTMQKNPRYASLIDEIIVYLKKAILRAFDAGVASDKIVIDPGIGFGKTAEHNLHILNRLNDFKILGKPLLIGPSRKAFIGKLLDVPPQDRIFGTVASCCAAVKRGAHIVRVHDVASVKQALRVIDSIHNQCKQ